MDYSIEDGLAKLASDGLLTAAEHDFLFATHTAIQEAELSKEADAKTEGAGRFATFVREFGLGNLLLAGAAATPLVSMGINHITNPVREAMRYKNMQQLPNAAKLNLSPDQSRSFYVPEGTQDEMANKAVRKAFAILHRYAPEITRTPELAHDFLHHNTGAGVEKFIENAVGYARNPVEVGHKREQMADWQRAHIRNTATGMKVVLDQFNPKPDVAPELTREERNRMTEDLAFHTTRGKGLAAEDLAMMSGSGPDPAVRPPNFRFVNGPLTAEQEQRIQEGARVARGRRGA